VNIRLGVRTGLYEGLEDLEKIPALADSVPALLEPGRLAQRLDDLRTWQNDGLVQLHDLLAKRSGVGAGSRPLAGEPKQAIARACHRLIVGLGKNALAIATLEAAR